VRLAAGIAVGRGVWVVAGAESGGVSLYETAGFVKLWEDGWRAGSIDSRRFGLDMVVLEPRIVG
jgi:hypothetical protein